MDGKEISILVAEGGFDTIKLVVRHAERPLFKGMRAPQGVSITENGKKEAERLGRSLKENGIQIDGCASSTVRRCIQTAEFIALGNQFEGLPETSPCLGGSGLFMDDSEALDRTLDTWTLEDVIGNQLAGIKVPGFNRLESGLQILLGRVLSDKSKRFEVFVSHDLFVCPAVHYLTETHYTAEGNTGFLGGFFIVTRGDRTSILWDSRWYDVTDRLRSLFERKV